MEESCIMSLLIVVVILLVIFAPILGIGLAYGFGMLLIFGLPILFVLCILCYLILWPINKYFDNPENERKYQAWVDSLFAKGDEKRKRKNGIVTDVEMKTVYDYFTRHRSFKNCPIYLSLSQEQKHNVHKKMHWYNPSSVRIVHKDSSKNTYEPN
jgi:hypothetical protein